MEFALWVGGMASQTGRVRVGRPALAAALVRPRPSRRPGAGGRGGVQAPRRDRRRQGRHPHPRRRDHSRARHRFAEGEVSAAHSDRRRYLVPVVQRTRQRFRRRRCGDASRFPRQSMDRQRAEGMDHQRAQGALGAVAGAHRLGPAEAPGPVVFHARYEAAGCDGAALAPDERLCLVQPGVLYRRQGRARVPRLRGWQRLGGNDNDLDARAPRRRRVAQLGDPL